MQVNVNLHTCTLHSDIVTEQWMEVFFNDFPGPIMTYVMGNKEFCKTYKAV